MIMMRMSKIERSSLTLGTLVGAVSAIVGWVWVAHPGLGVFAQNPGTAVLSDLAGPRAAALAQALVGTVAVAAGIAGLARLLSAKGIVAAAVLQILVFGALLQSSMVLNTAGYLLAAAMPIIGIVLLIQLFRRYPRARLLVGFPIVLVALTAILFLHDQIARLVVLISHGMLTGIPMMLPGLMFALIGLCWSTAAAASLWNTPAGAGALTWIVRHRVLFTLIAAGSLLPYGLSRVTWLTPWPQFGGVGIDLPARLWGLTLGVILCQVIDTRGSLSPAALIARTSHPLSGK